MESLNLPEYPRLQLICLILLGPSSYNIRKATMLNMLKEMIIDGADLAVFPFDFALLPESTAVAVLVAVEEEDESEAAVFAFVVPAAEVIVG